MRRIVLVALSTLTVLVLLLGYRTSLAGRVDEQTSASAGVTPGGSSAVSSGRSTGSTTVTGPVAQTQWGPVQVALTIAGGKVTDVDVPQYPDGNPRDQEINDYALPVLVQETLDAQSASIDMVSGATVTSDGYVRSLQGALDQAAL